MARGSDGRGWSGCGRSRTRGDSRSWTPISIHQCDSIVGFHGRGQRGQQQVKDLYQLLTGDVVPGCKAPGIRERLCFNSKAESEVYLFSTLRSLFSSMRVALSEIPTHLIPSTKPSRSLTQISEGSVASCLQVASVAGDLSHKKIKPCQGLGCIGVPGRPFTPEGINKPLHGDPIICPIWIRIWNCQWSTGQH